MGHEEITDDVARLFPSRRDARRAVREQLYLPPHLLPVTAATVDGTGRTWVRREKVPGMGEVEWWVIGANGALSARAVTSPEVTLLDGGATAIWGTMPGEFDVPYIVRYRIGR